MPDLLALAREYRGPARSPLGRSAITGWAAGDSLPIRLAVNLRSKNADGTPATIERAVFTAKRNKTDTDAQAVLVRVVVPVANAYGQVTDTGADGRGEVYFTLIPADTALLGTTPYFFDARARLTNGEVVSLDSGLLLLTEGVTDDGANANNVGTITVTPANPVIIIGGTQQMTATVKDTELNVITGRVGQWVTGNPAIARVDPLTGLLTGVTNGTTDVAYVSERVVGRTTVTVAIDDVGILAGDLGGDAEAIGIYTMRKKVRSSSGVVTILDDARVATDVGRLFLPGNFEGASAGNLPNLDAQQRLSAAVWFTNEESNTLIARWDGSGDATKKQFKLAVTGAGLLEARLINAGAEAIATGATVLAVGKTYKATVVYDGSGGTNADRLKIYLAVFDDTAQTWGADVAEVITFTGAAIPATLSTAVSATNFTLGQQADTNAAGKAFLEEVRAWVGTALTAGQVTNETLTANPVAASLRYTFADLTNSGSLAGFALTIGSSCIICSNDRRYGPPIFFLASARPAYDAGAQTATFDDVDDKGVLHFTAAQAAAMGTDFGIAIVATVPAWDGSGSDRMAIIQALPSQAGRGMVDVYVSDAANVQNDAFRAVGNTVNVATARGSNVRRVIHARRTVAGGNITVHIRNGSTAEASSAPQANSLADTPYSAGLGAAESGAANPADMVFRALVILKTHTGARQVTINTWANTYEGATL